MWSGSENSSSPLAVSLATSLAERGLLAPPQNRSGLRQRIELLGKAEWSTLAHLDLHQIDPAKAVRLLGKGYAFTEFLIAPVAEPPATRTSVCSLGALMNLMVVVCDRLLDAGEGVQSVLPAAQLAASGSEASPVMVLLREYFRRLPDTCREKLFLQTIRKSVTSMFEAEIQTVSFGSHLPYRFWLRKCSLPFVLMGLPACCENRRERPERYFRHLRWLYRVGRFFGALDDAMDREDDARTGHPNYWNAYDCKLRPSVASKIADYGGAVLGGWESLLPSANQNVDLRETFLYFVRGWLETPGGNAHSK